MALALNGEAPFPRMTPAPSSAAELRIIVPRFPGSAISGRTTRVPSLIADSGGFSGLRAIARYPR